MGNQAEDGEPPEKLDGDRLKVPVDSIPKARSCLPDGALRLEGNALQNCGWQGPGWGIGCSRSGYQNRNPD